MEVRDGEISEERHYFGKHCMCQGEGTKAHDIIANPVIFFSANEVFVYMSKHSLSHSLRTFLHS